MQDIVTCDTSSSNFDSSQAKLTIVIRFFNAKISLFFTTRYTAFRCDATYVSFLLLPVTTMSNDIDREVCFVDEWAIKCFSFGWQIFLAHLQ